MRQCKVHRYIPKKKIAVAIGLLIGISSIAIADTTQSNTRIFAGQVGKKDAVLCIDPEEKTGRYFYQQNGIDIPLQLSNKGGSNFIFSEAVNEDETNTTTWSVKLQKDAIQGNLVNPQNGKKVPVNFKLKQVLPLENEQDSFLKCGASLDFKTALKSYYVQAKVNRPVRVTHTYATDAVKVQQVFEPLSKANWVQISAHPNAQIQKKLNNLLHFQFQEKIFRALDCTSTTNMSDAAPGFIEQNLKVRLLTADMLSVEERIFGSCGGAHPFGGLTGATYDLKTREVIKTENIFKPAFYKVGGENSEYTDAFPDVLIKYFSASNKKEERSMVECFPGAVYLDAWFDKSGVWFSGNNYRAHECGEPFLIPYQALQETFNEKIKSMINGSGKK